VAKLRLLLGDDHLLLLHGLKKILEEKPEWQVVGEAADGREAVRLAVGLSPEVAVLDIGMPLLNGIEATRQIVKRVPDCRVLILSMHSDEVYITRAIQAGAKGFLLKDAADKDLISGIGAVAAGKTFFSHVVAQSMLDDYMRRVANDTAKDSFDLLSEREREILQLIAEGHSNKDVALMLSISPATVETHRSHILEKLDVHNTAELVLYAVRRGVIR
jgi:two-component system, NarL family, response regulator NreC